MKIEKLNEDVFKVTVLGNLTTQHEVTVTDIAYQHLTSGRATKEELLDFSFKFLLQAISAGIYYVRLEYNQQVEIYGSFANRVEFIISGNS